MEVRVVVHCAMPRGGRGECEQAVRYLVVAQPLVWVDAPRRPRVRRKIRRCGEWVDVSCL